MQLMDCTPHVAYAVSLSNCPIVGLSGRLMVYWGKQVLTCAKARLMRKGDYPRIIIFSEKRHLPPLPIMRHIGLTEAHITLETNR